MGFVDLKQMAKLAKIKEEEVMDLVESGVIKPQKSYCHPGDFGDGRQIAFYPEEALADIKAAPKVKPAPKDPFEEPVPEKAEDEDEEKGEPEPEAPEPEPEKPKAKDKAKKPGKK